MRARVAFFFVLGAAVGLGGCATEGLLDPVEPDEVSITLAVSGGLAGADYSFLIDGKVREVRGIHCA